jgi:DNA-binding Lrp family transcriptional regulator
VSVNPAFVFIKVSPFKRVNTYAQIIQLPVERMYRVTGDMDAIVQVGREKLDDALKKLAELDGIEDTKSYITIQTLK